MKNLLRRIGALAAAVMMCFALTVPALAEESVVAGSASLTVARLGHSSGTWGVGTKDDDGYTYNAIPSPTTSSLDYYLLGAGVNGYYVDGVGWKYLTLDSSLFPEGASCSVYLSSFYYYNISGSYYGSQNHAPSVSDFNITVKDSSTSAYSSSPASSVILYEPSNDYLYLSDGCTVSFRYSNSVSSPVSSVILSNGLYNDNEPSWYFAGFWNEKNPHWRVDSFRVVSSDSDATLDGLENIADSIAAQNSMLSAYYGDIVEICNQIYQRLGDMQQTQIEANELLSSLVSLLNSTNGKISALNQAMSTYFELVLKSLENESLSIQDCINDAELRLETYLKPIVDYFTELEETTGESASSLPGHKTDLDKWSSDSTGIDDDAQTGLAAVLPVLSAFSFIFQIVGIFIGLGIFRVIIKKGVS